MNYFLEIMDLEAVIMEKKYFGYGNRKEKSEILDFDEYYIKQVVLNSIRTLDASLKRQLV